VVIDHPWTGHRSAVEGPASQHPIRIAVLNDYPVVVAGVTAMLAPFCDRVQVVQRGTDHQVREDLDLVLYDTFGVADHAPVEIGSLLQRTPAPLVVFSWITDPVLVRQSLEAGAAGFLAKTMSPEQLVASLEKIHAGAVIAPPTARDGARRGHPAWPGAEFGLTPRESEIVALIARGLSNRDIADRSYLSINSVKTYIRTAYRKMGVKTRPQAVLWLVRHGFDPESRATEHV
jgi:NarL family two-component system response regulator LiaR